MRQGGFGFGKTALYKNGARQRIRRRGEAPGPRGCGDGLAKFIDRALSGSCVVWSQAGQHCAIGATRGQSRRESTQLVQPQQNQLNITAIVCRSSPQLNAQHADLVNLAMNGSV